MNVEILVGIVSVFSAITATIAAVASLRREELRHKIDLKEIEKLEEDRNQSTRTAFTKDSTALYARLSDQYELLTGKDKKLMQTITFVIRNMIVLNRTISELVTEMEHRMGDHEEEANDIHCPFYETISEFMGDRLIGIRSIVEETLVETERLLFDDDKKDTDD